MRKNKSKNKNSRVYLFVLKKNHVSISADLGHRGDFDDFEEFVVVPPRGVVVTPLDRGVPGGQGRDVPVDSFHRFPITRVDILTYRIVSYPVASYKIIVASLECTAVGHYYYFPTSQLSM